MQESHNFDVTPGFRPSQLHCRRSLAFARSCQEALAVAFKRIAVDNTIDQHSKLGDNSAARTTKMTTPCASADCCRDGSECDKESPVRGGDGAKCCDSGGAKIKKSCCDVGGACAANRDTSEVRRGCCDGSRTSSCCISAKTNSDSSCTANQVGCCKNGMCDATKNSNILYSDKDDKDRGLDPLLCLALLRPGRNDTIDVYDVKGQLKSFRTAPTSAQSIIGRKICYSTHGAGNGADGLLTPCFDEKGEHGEPEEGCFCGIDEPHLHAHYYDPDRCSEDNCNGKVKAGGEPDFKYLAELTLHPVEEEDTEENFSDDGTSMDPMTRSLSMPINASLPRVCNSGDIQKHLKERGLQLSHWLDWRRGRRLSNKIDGFDSSSRKYRVHHEDHIDYLVHNQTTGDLHLEHPCNECNSNDVHGTFSLIHSRSWMDDGDEPPCAAAARRSDSKEIRLHFFQARTGPFHLLDLFSGLFELESGRVQAIRALDVIEGSQDVAVLPTETESSAHIGRSHFFVEKICCASEIPAINAIVKPLNGVVAVKINTTSKMVYVDHNVDSISANSIANALNEERFGAKIVSDAAQSLAEMAGIPTDVFVESNFEVSVLTGSAMANDIESCLQTTFPESQLRHDSINLSSDKILTVEHNPYYLNVSTICNTLREHSFQVETILDGAKDGLWAISLNKNLDETIDIHKTKVRWTVVLSGVFWIISMLSYIGGNWEYLKYIAIVSVVFGLPPIALKAFRTLQRCHFDANCMMLFAALGAVALQEYAEAAAVTFLFAISETLESKASARARNALSAIVRLRPDRANVINPITKDIVVLPATAVQVGTTVVVKTGGKVPCDGVVLEGKSTVDESSLTGESVPVSKSSGSMVSGGTINTGLSRLIVKTTATSENSAVARLIRLVEEAQANRSETEKLVDRFASIYTPFVVLLALGMCTIPWAFGREVGRFWTMNGLIAIVIACPCSLIISTPVTYVAGLAAAAQKGVIVKGGAHLESLANVNQICFDKTGTLTEGVFLLLHVIVIGNRSRKEVLEYLALMEAPASHPLSKAIVDGAANEQVVAPNHLRVENHTILPGEGITAVVEDKNVYVGNVNLFQRLGLYNSISDADAALVVEWAKSGATVGFIGIEGEGIIGAYSVSDKVRNESKTVVKTLVEMGISCVMLTGDQSVAAIGVGSQIGLGPEAVRSELLPEDKLDFIAHAVETNKRKKFWNIKKNVMMCGDGVNDGPALALADVAVAMGEGAALAMETSDITLLDSNLNKMLFIIRMGRRVVRTIIENVAFSLITKAVVMGFTFAGKASLWAAIASDVGAMLLVTLNGMKLLPSSRKSRGSNDLASPNRDQEANVIDELPSSSCVNRRGSDNPSAVPLL